MMEDEWLRNTCDEVDSIFEKKEEVRKRTEERTKERGEYEKEREG